jgi:hypothetical protein
MNASTRLFLVLMSMIGLARVEASETNYFLVDNRFLALYRRARTWARAAVLVDRPR